MNSDNQLEFEKLERYAKRNGSMKMTPVLDPDAVGAARSSVQLFVRSFLKRKMQRRLPLFTLKRITSKLSE